MSKLIRYSEAFKSQVVSEIERGKFRSVSEASRAYGIKGTTTIAKWLHKRGREDLLPKRVRIESMKEINELKEARKRIRELEVAVADAHIDYCLEKGYLHEACDRLGENMEAFKKKHVMTLSSMRKRQKGR